jgi:hypothetical protein
VSGDTESVFQKSPFLTASTAVAGLLTCLNTLSVSLALPPFWLDSITGAICLFVAANWFTSVLLHERRVIFYSASRALGETPLKAFIGSLVRPRTLALLFIPSLLLIASLLFLSNPIQRLLQPKWSLCGIFIARCENPCIALLDSRKRDVLGTCLPRGDDSGYREIKPPSFSTYRPAFISVECDGKTGTTSEISYKMFSPKCEGEWRE